MASQGYGAASLSQPGYGHSDGPRIIVARLRKRLLWWP
jgi:hypothetical protein